MAPTLDWMMRATRVGDVDPAAMRLVTATRLAVLCQRRGVDPLPLLTRRLGCRIQAVAFLHLVSIVGTAWPEAFSLSPPCCRTLSHDEALLAELAEAVLSNDRRGFDAQGRDLLNEDARDFLWREMAAVLGRTRTV